MMSRDDSATLTRVVRVFVSSTFRDMQTERDELIKFVFPQLRGLCAARGVAWSAVDLRWGITDEQAAEGQVLPICLAEIDRSRPYFIGLLGERYGTVPDAIDPNLAAREGWLDEHSQRSVTELEILHGVLNDRTMAQHAFFYFRDPRYLESLSPHERAAFTEEPSPQEIAEYGPEAAHQQASERRRKLEALKARIRTSGVSVREDFPDPRTLGQWVLEDLTALIDRLFPANQVPNALDRAAAEQEAYASDRRRVFVGRAGLFEHLDRHLEGNGPPLIVTGPPGSGKSALLAAWHEHVRSGRASRPGSMPDARQGLLSRIASLLGRRADLTPPILVVAHFLEAGGASADPLSLVDRVLGELARGLGLQLALPGSARVAGLSFVLRHALVAASERRRIILLLDGVDHVASLDPETTLGWLPTEIPAGVRLVVSTAPGPALDELLRRGWSSLQLEPLTVADRQAVITEYLSLQGRSLSANHVARIGQATTAATPLCLRVLLDELAVSGRHDALDEQITSYLQADSIERLYEMILTRWERDYERDRPGLVGDAMRLIWAARSGLTEDELLRLLGNDGDPLPQAYGSPLFLAAEGMLRNWEGVIGFSDSQFREAVARRHVQDDVSTVHARLVAFFEGQEPGARMLVELPWQLLKSRRYRRLQELLTEPPFIRAADTHAPLDLRRIWTALLAQPGYTLADAYRDVVNGEARDPSHASRVADLLRDLGDPGGALAIYEWLGREAERAGDSAGLARALASQASILYEAGEGEAAQGLLARRRQVRSAMRDGGAGADDVAADALAWRDSDARQIVVEALLLNRAGRPSDALALCKQAEQCFRDVHDIGGYAWSCNVQGLILQNLGDHAGALRLHEQHAALSRQLDDPLGLQTALGNQGIVQLRGFQNFATALDLHQQKERICRELGYRYGLQAALGNQGVVYRERGEPERSLEYFRQQEAICREIGNTDGLARSIGNQASAVRECDQLQEALRLHHEAVRLWRDLDNRRGLAIELHNVANLLGGNLGRYDEALPLAEEAYSVARDCGDRSLAGAILQTLAPLRRLTRASRE